MEFVWPSLCAACGCELGALCRHGICAVCWTSTVALGSQCRHCALPAARDSDLLAARGRCGACPPHLLPLRSVYGLWHYDHLARTLLLRAKLGRRFEWLEESGAVLGRIWQLERRTEVDAVVPIPSHPWVSLQRGFSPAAELARGVAASLGRPRYRLALRKRILAPRFVKRQSAGERLVRRDSLRTIRRFDGQTLLLVDDVMTTGATLGRSAELLVQAGAAAVHAAVWARTLPRSMV